MTASGRRPDSGPTSAEADLAVEQADLELRRLERYGVVLAGD